MEELPINVEAMEEGKDFSSEDIRKKVIPDLQIFSAWFTEVFNVNSEEAYLRRFAGNLRRLHADKFSPKD